MEITTGNLATNREQWASIDGYLNYEISWWGRVRNATTGRILKAGRSGSGYLTVALYREGKMKSHSVHVLVAREWVSNPDGKRCVDHMDNDRHNNNWVNLRYATQAENNRNTKNTSMVRASTRVSHITNPRESGWLVSVLLVRLCS